MISVGLPAFLWAGGAFALLPLALHFLTRRPPERQPLPTARFLRPDARTLLRFKRTPADVALLVLRMLFALLLGAAFADLSWRSTPKGSAHVVLLDGGAGWDDAWPAALEAARAADQTVADGRGSGGSGAPEADLERVILAYGTADGSRVVAPDELEKLDVGDRVTAFDDGLYALRSLTAARRWSRVSVEWITPGTWSQWTSGLAFRRDALWPGAISWIDVAVSTAEPDAADDTPTDARTEPISAPPFRAVVDEQPGGASVARAVTALGGVTGPSPAADGTGPVWFASGDPGSRGGRDAWVEMGRTLVTASPERTALPTGTGIRVLAVRNDASPRATAEPVGAGCRVRIGNSWEAVADQEGAGLPDFVATLIRGCEQPGAGLPLDRAARDRLARPDLPGIVDTTDLGGGEVPLTRWILGLLALLLAAEVALTWGNPPRGMRTAPGVGR